MTLKSISILHDERISTTVTVALPLVRILAIHYKYLLNVCYVPDTILGPGDTAVNKTAKPCTQSLRSCREDVVGVGNKQKKKDIKC